MLFSLRYFLATNMFHINNNLVVRMKIRRINSCRKLQLELNAEIYIMRLVFFTENGNLWQIILNVCIDYWMIVICFCIKPYKKRRASKPKDSASSFGFETDFRFESFALRTVWGFVVHMGFDFICIFKKGRSYNT